MHRPSAKHAVRAFVGTLLLPLFAAGLPASSVAAQSASCAGQPVATDGTCLNTQGAQTQAVFNSLWGAQAAQEWVNEHNAALAASAGPATTASSAPAPSSPAPAAPSAPQGPLNPGSFVASVDDACDVTVTNTGSVPGAAVVEYTGLTTMYLGGDTGTSAPRHSQGTPYTATAVVPPSGTIPPGGSYTQPSSTGGAITISSCTSARVVSVS